MYRVGLNILVEGLTYYLTLLNINYSYSSYRKDRFIYVVTQAIIELLYPIKKLVHTITSDNGKEFSYHEEIANKLNLKFYFCDPYSSWQRGLNEHTNGLIREYIPKKSSFETVNQTQIVIIQNRLNNRPRKILKYYIPNEIFFKEVSRKMVA